MGVYYVKGKTAGCSTMAAMLTIDDVSDDLPPKDQRFLWIDLFCLRQCLADFTPNAVVELIRDTGCFAAMIDWKWTYVKRSFCIIELYAAVLGDCKLAIASPATTENEARDMLMPEL